MKKLLATSALFAAALFAKAQVPAYATLDINNIEAQVNSEGSLFWDFANAKFEVPKGSNRHTIFANALWIGGYDASSTLKIAGATYRQTGNDFWPGPLDITGSTNAATIAAYDKIWKLNQCDIDAYVTWWNGGQVGINPVDPAAMNMINTWPGNAPDGVPLAPYADMNSNGTYDPYAGDYPLIKGDQALFFVYNDKGGVHTETGGQSIGLEFQCMVYGYGCSNDSALNNTIFTNYKIINKSSFRLDSAFIGNWTDFDIGSASDDFIGCDVARSAFYAYNGNMIDDNSPAGQFPYGTNPPAQAVVFLAGPYAKANGLDDPAASVPNGFNYGDGIPDNERLGMSRFVYYNNDFSPTGNPSSAVDFYNYMTGTWKDATPVTYGGTGHLTGVNCDYMFPGVTDPSGFGTSGVPQPAWDETTSGNVPADRRGLGSSGPFTFQPGSIQELDFAYVFGRATSGGNLASVTVMQERIDSIRQKFEDGITGCGCASLTGISENENASSLLLYPNPANENITVQISSITGDYMANIYDARGRLVITQKLSGTSENTIGISGLKKGLYLINITDGERSFTKRFVKQ